MVQVFLSQKRFEGGAGFQVTEEMRVNIAAQACFLLLHLPAGCYPGLKTVIVYPRTYGDNREIRAHLDALGHHVEGPPERLGESWQHGTVVVSWDSALHGALNAADGRNVVFHEFAHRLDQEDGAADGVPAAFLGGSIRTWAAVIARHHEQLCRESAKSRRTVLDVYGATNVVEFFAVASEAFFEKPRQVRRYAPDLYRELAGFYGVDPAVTFPREVGASSPTGESLTK
jgi:Mlc titration factor MtfA (ptsG expression regulator)